ncbi:hypothetical protein KAR10_05165, partial [bacterium]|nr:hypothetical protein [bacterium]
MKQYFEYQREADANTEENFSSGSANKFWEIDSDYDVVITRSGEIGQPGKTARENFDTASDA